MNWEVWSRYKKLQGTSFPGTQEEAVKFIEDEATFRQFTNVQVQSETDQILSWTIDSSGHKRRFISMNAE